MTSPVATVGLTYDGTDLQRSDLSIFCQIVRGLNEPPSVRGGDVIIPAAAGRMEGLRVNDVVAIELDCFVLGTAGQTTDADEQDSYRTNAKTLRTLFAPNRDRADLVALLEDGTVATISARPLNAIWREDVQSHMARVSVALEGYDDWVLGS